VAGRSPSGLRTTTASVDVVFVHPHALCEAPIGDGTRVWAFAHVMAGAVVGRDCNVGGQSFIEAGAVVGDGVTIKNGVSVWRGVTLEDSVFVGPNAVFTNDLRPRAHLKVAEGDLVPTTVRTGATIGANATIVCGITIGSFAFVAAGAVVTRDVPDHALVVGSPAKRRGWVCRCARPLVDRCDDCGTELADVDPAQDPRNT
jgi:UDP-2-acetamido-3-amino-2,3-dideoxy-glucuronate N-acetyltransferase